MSQLPPLSGVRVLEFAGLAPGPYAGMLLVDAGASVLRIDRAVDGQTHDSAGICPASTDPLARRKASIAVDLKSPGGVSFVRALTENIDVLIDPFRPGVLEKLGLGPDVLRAKNRRLIYARLTGFRRDGKYAAMAGHDINYLAVSGVLSMLGRSGQNPQAPINLMADFAGGGAVLFQAILLALLARDRDGSGQVIETNMVDGCSHLASAPRFLRGTPIGERPRGENLLDGGCPFYDTYETKDGEYMSVGALEPQFFDMLIGRLGFADRGWSETRHDRATWPEMRAGFEAKFKTRTRQDWEAVFDGSDACCLPVLDYSELERLGTDQRPFALLGSTPLMDIPSEASTTASPGYQGHFVNPGVGGEEVLRHWLGWKRGSDFEVEKGGLIVKAKPKL